MPYDTWHEAFAVPSIAVKHVTVLKHENDTNNEETGDFLFTKLK